MRVMRLMTSSCNPWFFCHVSFCLTLLAVNILEASRVGQSKPCIAMPHVWHPQVHPDVRTTTGITMMMLASYGGHTEACQVLIDRRALTGLLKSLYSTWDHWMAINSTKRGGHQHWLPSTAFTRTSSTTAFLARH